MTVLTRAVKAATEEVHRSVVKPVLELRIPEPEKAMKAKKKIIKE